MESLRSFVFKTIEKYLNENVNIEYYEHGQCELFALALHKTLNYNMYFLIDNSAEFETDDGIEFSDALIHAYCRDGNGNYFDASGLVSLENIESEHAEYVNDPEHVPITEKEFYEYVNSGFISIFSTSELNNLQNYIRENISKYTVQ